MLNSQNRQNQIWNGIQQQSLLIVLPCIAKRTMPIIDIYECNKEKIIETKKKTNFKKKLTYGNKLNINNLFIKFRRTNDNGSRNMRSH